MSLPPRLVSPMIMMDAECMERLQGALILIPRFLVLYFVADSLSIRDFVIRPAN